MILFFLITIFIYSAYKVSFHRIEKYQQKSGERLAALPKFYGYFAGAMMAGVLMGVLCLYQWMALSLESFFGILLFIGFGVITLFLLPKTIKPSFKARHTLEKAGYFLFIVAALLSIVITTVVVLLLISESFRFFTIVPLQDFLFGTVWSPEISHGYGKSQGQYGALPLFAGTFLITGIALCIGGFLGLMVAIYTSQFANPLTRTFLKPALEILAGIPTIVYGFFALTVVAPFLHSLGEWFHLSISSESALGAGLVMGLMILPIISSLSDDALASLPGELKQNALAMGATPSEAIRTILLPAAFPGIIGSFLLAVSRAIGETMLVLMAASLQPNLTGNPLNAVTTVTVQIVSLLTGDQEFDSPKTLSAFALALVLFLMTLALNIIALFLVNRHAKRYEL